MQDMKLKIVGDSAVLVQFEEKIDSQINATITSLVRMVREQQIEGVIDMIPAFCSLLIHYDPRIINYENITKRLSKIMEMDITTESSAKVVYEIPVCYGGEYGPDLENVMEHANLTKEEVIKIHTSKDYLIYMLGFLPGFTYLGGLDERIHTPRLANPRVSIAAGSVGIGGAQTGIYPLDSPGGWQLIGKTPIKTYDPESQPPILFQAGQYICFVPVSSEEYDVILEEVIAGTYKHTIRSGEVD
ncbi:MAG: 5-oxoprolinase subunit PxpB [Eubacteriales bacterium]